ncbi:MAG: hypothetical protein IJ752_04390 [Alphaproteobacteria bacterium]|nr:hypothetical protein [Alphaproteobacteria bacterium]
MKKVDRLKRTQEQLAFAAADTVCFFAPYPEDLRCLQEQEWLPVIDWVNGLGCDFKPVLGLKVPPLSDRTQDFLQKRLNALSEDAFLAFCAVSGSCRSVILALAVSEGFLSAEQAFDLSVLEERFQNRFWPEEPDALASRNSRRQAVLEAAEKLKGK